MQVSENKKSDKQIRFANSTTWIFFLIKNSDDILLGK